MEEHPPGWRVFFVAVGGVVRWCQSTFCRFCAWHHIPFLYLAPYRHLVPGTKNPPLTTPNAKKQPTRWGWLLFASIILFPTRPCLHEFDKRLVVGVDQADALDEPFDGEEQDREEDQASPDGGHGEDDGG
jgi:hypothetical protein